MKTKPMVQNEELIVTQHPDYTSEVVTLLRSNLTPKIKQERILSYHENDIAAALDLLTEEERNRLYHILDTDTLANVLEYSETPNHYINELGIRKRIDVLLHFEITTTVEYLRQMEKAERNMLLELMDNDIKREIILLSSFHEDEIGSKMTTNYISIHTGTSIRQAMRELIEQAADNDNISTLYVIDEEETLIGAVDLKDLIIARDNTDLASITMTSYPYVYANEQIEDCIERIKDYSEDSIPVLDSDNKLKGVLTSQDITQLVDDEMGDDYAKLAGLSSEEDLQEPLKKSILKRLPWLIILLGMGLLVSSVVGIFEHVVAHLTLIISFQSLVLDMAGNVGTQSLAVTIRVLMDEKISGRQKLYLIGKEARIGLVNGMVLGILSFLFIGLYLVILKGQSTLLAFTVSLCTGIALLVSILLSSIAGTVIPLIFKKLHIDPAVASGPLITTINDLVAVVTYYGLAWILLIYVLHL
ncbi:MAG: magnesium transporter [Lachnospiraceae bacterium]|nr:magnesium transporter [Lachnospiraceae bacterium]